VSLYILIENEEEKNHQKKWMSMLSPFSPWSMPRVVGSLLTETNNCRLFSQFYNDSALSSLAKDIENRLLIPSMSLQEGGEAGCIHDGLTVD
jgi:hypothetical protein